MPGSSPWCAGWTPTRANPTGSFSRAGGRSRWKCLSPSRTCRCPDRRLQSSLDPAFAFHHSPTQGRFVMRWSSLVAAFALGVFASTASADAPKKRLLLVTHSGGFIHGSVVEAEKVLKEIGPKYGLEVTCYRFTNDPDAKVK